MKTRSIRRVHLHPYSAPLTQPFRIAIGELREAQGVFVRLETDDGLEGLGEAAPLPAINDETQGTCLAIGKELGRVLVGRDPVSVATRVAELDAAIPHNPCIKAAFDMALWDLLGKITQLPVYRLLGGDSREIETDETVSIAPLEQMREAAESVSRRGYRAIKLKVGAASLEDDVAKVSAIRAAVGDGVRLRIDANQAWDVPTAIAALRVLAEFGVEFCRTARPPDNLEALRAVRRASPIPIMADEAVFSARDALRVIHQDAADFINIKLMKCGGITEAVRIGHLARSAGMRCMVGCMIESRVAISAGVHFAAADPTVAFTDLDGHQFFQNDPTTGGFQQQDWRITLTDEPGLGIDLRPDFAKTLERVSID